MSNESELIRLLTSIDNKLGVLINNSNQLVKEFVLTVNPDSDASCLLTRNSFTADDRTPSTIKDFVALIKQEVRSIDDGGLGEDRLHRNISHTSPWCNLLVQEMHSKEDLDFNNLIFGVHFIIDLPYEEYPTVLASSVQKYMDKTLYGYTPWLGETLTMTQYASTLTDNNIRRAVTDSISLNGW